MSGQSEDDVLKTIDSNGSYLLPFGFEQESLDTTLHRSIRRLIARGSIQPDGESWLGYQKWVRSK
jgi:hypothetical protein